MGECTCELRLGMRVRDKVTKVEGTLTCIANYWHESSQYLIEYVDKNGLACEKWVGINRLEVIE